MKILLVRPNYKSHIITPPIGLGYLSSYLRKHDIEVIILDGLRDNLDNDVLHRKILAENPDAVGITCLTAFYGEVVDLSRRLKKDNLLVVIGGVHPTFLPLETLNDSNCDYVVMGEGEIALLKLIQCNFKNDGIVGVYSKEDIETGKNRIEKAERIGQLDELPFPDWEQINPNKYPKAPHGAIVKNFPVAPIMTTRGCPYGCTFCASPKFYDRKVRFRSPENVIGEIKYLTKRFGIKEIHFEDDNLTIDRRHIEKICELIIENNIKISWACPNGIRADKVDKALIGLMKKSGCYYFAYGVESADQQILNNIKKQETIETIENSICLAHKAGISCQGFFIFGLPGETKETIDKSIRFARKSKLDRAQFLILDVLPGSELWDTLKGRFVPNWGKNSYKEPEWLPGDLTKEHLMQSQSRAFFDFYFKSPIRFLKLALSINPGQIKYLFKRLVDYRIIKRSKPCPSVSARRDISQESLVIVMPTHNEADCIEKVCRAWLNLLNSFSSGKLLVVNDGSKDKTGEILEALAKDDARLIVLSQANVGHGASLLIAYRAALEYEPEWIFHVDSDDQFFPEDFDKLWEKRTDSRFILGFRKTRNDPFHRLVITCFVRLLNFLFFGVWIPDSNIPYRLIQADYLRRLLAELPSGVFAPNIFLAVLAAKCGERLQNISIRHVDRSTGQVSIIGLRLLKVCATSVAELIAFRSKLNASVLRLKALHHG